MVLCHNLVIINNNNNYIYINNKLPAILSQIKSKTFINKEMNNEFFD